MFFLSEKKEHFNQNAFGGNACSAFGKDGICDQIKSMSQEV